MHVEMIAVGFSDPKFFDAGWGKLLTTPTVGGLAVLLAAILALVANWRKISADKADTTNKIKAASDELDKKIAADRVDSDRRLSASREEAVRTRRGEAYVDVLQVVGHIGHWAQRVRPAIDTNPPQTPPALPDVEQQAASQARLQVYGTEQVQTLWRAWDACVSEIQRADRQIGYMLAGSHRMSAEAVARGHDNWGRLEDELRPAELEGRRKLASQMNHELAAAGPTS